MVLFNYSTRELTAKIVYYGPGLCGKTTNLQFIHENLPETVKGKMLSLATKTDRTLFFDFLPIDLGEIRGMKTRVQLYTVPGQVFYNETRKLVLKGADGIVFVADSQEQMLGANVESYKNLEDNLKAHGMRLGDMPHVIQFNKRDLPKLASIEDLNTAINRFNAPFYESVATTGIGVQDTLKAIVKLVLLHLTRKYDPKSAAAVTAKPAVAPPPPAPIAAAPPSSPSRPSAARPAIPFAAVPPVPEPRPSRPAVRQATPQPAAAAARVSPPVAEFNDDEIDSLMTEIDAAAAPETAPAKPAWPEAEGESVWMGSPDEDVIMSRTSPDAIEEAYEKTLDEPGEDEPAADAPLPETTGRFDPLDFEPETIDRLADPLPSVDEPPPVPPMTAWTAAASSVGAAFEIDRGFDPEWARVEPDPLEIAPSASSQDYEAGIPVSPPPDLAPLQGRSELRFDPEPDAPPLRFDGEAEPPVAGPPEDPAIVLSEVVEDRALFTDPTLEIAKLDADDVREIVVPVQLGEGAEVKRYKLSIRLRLDPVD